MKSLLVVITLTLLAGCASGPSYKESKNTLPVLSETQARVVVFRTKESKLYLAKGTPLAMNGTKMATVGYGGFAYSDVTPGTYTLKTEVSDWPGSCEIGFSIEQPNKSYFFEIKPRDESYDAFKDGSSIVFPVITGISAAAKESKEKTCGGLFALVPVTEEEAAAKLEK